MCICNYGGSNRDNVVTMRPRSLRSRVPGWPGATVRGSKAVSVGAHCTSILEKRVMENPSPAGASLGGSQATREGVGRVGVRATRHAGVASLSAARALEWKRPMQTGRRGKGDRSVAGARDSSATSQFSSSSSLGPVLVSVSLVFSAGFPPPGRNGRWQFPALS